MLYTHSFQEEEQCHSFRTGRKESFSAYIFGALNIEMYLLTLNFKEVNLKKIDQNKIKIGWMVYVK